MALEIRTAAELIAVDVEGRGAARRAARETELLQRACCRRSSINLGPSGSTRSCRPSRAGPPRASSRPWQS